MLKPLESGRWNFTTAAHLVNRAGFGGSPVEIDKLVALGVDGAVSHFEDYEKTPDETTDPAWAKPDPDRAERFMAARGAGGADDRKILHEEQQRHRQRVSQLR